MILLLINIAAPILLPGIAFCCYCLFVVCQCLELLILVIDSREGILAESQCLISSADYRQFLLLLLFV